MQPQPEALNPSKRAPRLLLSLLTDDAARRRRSKGERKNTAPHPPAQPLHQLSQLVVVSAVAVKPPTPPDWRCDIIGQGTRPTTPSHAHRQSSSLTDLRPLLQLPPLAPYPAATSYPTRIASSPLPPPNFRLSHLPRRQNIPHHELEGLYQGRRARKDSSCRCRSPSRCLTLYLSRLPKPSRASSTW